MKEIFNWWYCSNDVFLTSINGLTISLVISYTSYLVWLYLVASNGEVKFKGIRDMFNDMLIMLVALVLCTFMALCVWLTMPLLLIGLLLLLYVFICKKIAAKRNENNNI